MNVAVIGAGHGGCAAAAVCAQRGHQVTLCKLGRKMHEANFEKIASTHQMELRGLEGDATVSLAHVTREPKEALAHADVIFVFYVSNFHQQVAERLAPHLRPGQLVVLGPGYASSLLFAAACRKAGNSSDVLYAELETLPYSSRIMQPGMIDVCSKNYRHPLAALPAIRTPAAIERLTPLLGECVPKSNVLEVALHNPNLSIHTVGTILNASRIQQTGEDFALYKHGFTEAVWNIVLRLDAEKMAVMRRVGGQPTSYFEEFVMRTFVDRSIDPMKGFEHYANEAPKGPSTIWTRYVTEDVPVGLGLLDSLGKAAGIPTPTADAVIHLAGVMHDRDYYAEARTMQVLWPGTLDGLLAYVQSGKQA